MSTGSLGHGLPMAVGMALARKIKGESGRIFCLIGDGECNEGSIWESALLASHHKLSNLICIIDYNHSADRMVNLKSLPKKFFAFGWVAIDIDGHDSENIHKYLTDIECDYPLAIIAETVKGHGISFMENNPAWHHRTPTDKEYKQIMKELK